MISGYYYCIQVGGGTTTSSASSPTTSGDGISIPSPIQTGMVSTCDRFYLVQSGDTCDSIIEAVGISLATFYAWNPAVGTSCATLDVDGYVYIDILGYTITSVPASTTTTSPADGISTPTPIQTGMVSTCNRFYLVQSGDTCASIVATAGTSLATWAISMPGILPWVAPVPILTLVIMSALESSGQLRQLLPVQSELLRHSQVMAFQLPHHIKQEWHLTATSSIW